MHAFHWPSIGRCAKGGRIRSTCPHQHPTRAAVAFESNRFTAAEFAIGDKRIEALKECAPGLTRVAFFFDPGTAVGAGDRVKKVSVNRTGNCPTSIRPGRK
jgi:hypothetical protein